MLSTDNWCIKVADKVYGPYTINQMGQFAAQGRLNAQSSISPAGGTVWRSARHYPNIAELLNGTKKQEKQFGKSDMHTDRHGPEEGELSNFIIIFDVISGAATKLERIIKLIGPAFRIADNVWVVSSDQTLTGVRNQLTPHLQIREQIFIIDAHRARSTWQNYTPELHSKLTKSWISHVS